MNISDYRLTAVWIFGAEIITPIEPPPAAVSPRRRTRRVIAPAAPQSPPATLEPCRLASPEMVRRSPWLVRLSGREPIRAGQLQQIGHAFRLCSGPTAKGKPAAVFRCECGSFSIHLLGAVRSGRVKACGCLAAKHKGLTIVGKVRCRSYDTWKDFVRFGKITHPRWTVKGGFERFIADLGRRPPGTRLARRIGAKGWVPGNCYWKPVARGVVFEDADDFPPLRSGKLTQVGETRILPRGKAGRLRRCIEVVCDCGSRSIVHHTQLATGKLRECESCRAAKRRTAR